MPLGIKAVVSAIYEPPQEGTRDGVKLEPAEAEKEATLAALASNLGLQRVGWIFTDLVASATTANKVELEHILKTIGCSHLRLKTSAESTPTSFQRR